MIVAGSGSRFEKRWSRWGRVSGEGSVSCSKLHFLLLKHRVRPQLLREEQEHYLKLTNLLSSFPCPFLNPISHCNVAGPPPQDVTGLARLICANNGTAREHKHCRGCSSKRNRRIRFKVQFRHWCMTLDRSKVPWPALASTSSSVCSREQSRAVIFLQLGRGRWCLK